MRYVIVIVSVAFFIIWDALFNDWSATTAVMSEIARARTRLPF